MLKFKAFLRDRFAKKIICLKQYSQRANYKTVLGF